jgi:hypothetical protein
MALPGSLVSLPYSELTLPPTPAAVAAAGRAFAVGGCGMLVVTGLPPALEALCAQLLDQAPTLPPRAVLRAEHGLGSDTSGPGSPLSATLQLRWEDASCGPSVGSSSSSSSTEAAGSSLRGDMEALGASWVTICAGVAAACDAWLAPLAPGSSATPLSTALLEAREAKARLIYYSARDGNGQQLQQQQPPWQEWHKDYGLFTAVSSPRYWSGAGQVCLQPPPGAGLHVLAAGSGELRPAPLPAGCLGVQLGEAAQILSGGALAAAPHCVVQPPLSQGGGALAAGGGSSALQAGQEEAAACSRATFVVFCQPPSAHPLRPLVHRGEEVQHSVYAAEDGAWQATLGTLLPPLQARWPGPGGMASPCTFTDFGKATVKGYFGKAGTQRQ